MAKSVYNFQTTRELIDRLQNDKTLRILCGWRYKNDIPSESTFSRAFDEISTLQIAQKTHKKFVKEYLSEKTFFIMQQMLQKYHLEKKWLKKPKKSQK